MPDTYTTVHGDTWDKIAYDLYGDEAYMRYLIEANWEFLDLLVFPAGIVLNLPEIPDEPDEDWPEWRLDDDEDEDIDADEIGGEEFDEEDDEYPDEDEEDGESEVDDEDE